MSQNYHEFIERLPDVLGDYDDELPVVVNTAVGPRLVRNVVIVNRQVWIDLDDDPDDDQ